MPFERSKFRELLMERCDVFRIGQGIAAANSAALDRRVQGWAKHDVVDQDIDPPERFKEPEADDAVQDDEVATTCLASIRLAEAMIALLHCVMAVESWSL